MRTVLLLALAMSAAPLTAQELDLSVQATLTGADSTATLQKGYTATLRHGGHAWIHPLLTFHYLEDDGADDLFLGAGLRVLLPAKLFAQWAVGRENIHDADGKWGAALSGGLLFGGIGIMGRWYYTFNRDDHLPQRAAVGLMWRIGGGS